LRIEVNGDSTEVADGSSVSQLLAFLDLKPDRLAIEVNRRIVRRGSWDSTTLAEGDKVEIVHFVGGGAR
jgi:thiamine biosynthesis protein ThiS